MLDAIQAREAFHITLLRRLVNRVPDGLRLKGGVNLRLFFGSVRYSEDMDFDADPRHGARMQEYLAHIVRDQGYKRELEKLGIDDVEPNEVQPAAGAGVKYKVNVILGGVRLPTKIEVSFRHSTPAEWAERTGAPRDIIEVYGGANVEDFEVTRYPHAVAVVQKVNALATRAGVQARDIFDLDWLLNQERFPNTKDAAKGLLRRVHTQENLDEAHRRCLDALDEQYRDQVESFLSVSARKQFDGQWTDMRLRVHGILGDVLKMPAPDPGNAAVNVPVDQKPPKLRRKQ